MSTSLCSTSYVSIRPPHAAAAAIDQHLLPPGPQQQICNGGFAAFEWVNRAGFKCVEALSRIIIRGL